MKRFTFAVAALLCAAPAATAANAGLRAKGGANSPLPGALQAARFATVQTGGAYPTSDGDITMREGLGENVPYPGSDYLGMGYNVLYGNPAGDEGTLEDPGWRGPVYRFGWCQEAQCLSQDMRFLRPMSGSEPVGMAKSNIACEMSKKVESVSTMNEYSRSLSVDAEVAGGFGAFGADVEFSASAGYSSFKSNVAETSKQRFEVKSFCTQFSLEIPTVSALTQSLRDPVFAAAAHALPASETGKEGVHGYDCSGGYDKCFSKADQATWFAFFDTFGTHFSTQIDLGGKMVLTTTVEETSTTSMSTKELTAAISASFETVFAEGSASLQTSTSQESMNKFGNMKKQTKVSVFGGLPPQDSAVGTSSGFGEWAETTSERPMPVKYKLHSIVHATGKPEADFNTAVKQYIGQRRPLFSAGPTSDVPGLQYYSPVTMPKLFPEPHSDRVTCGSKLEPGYGLKSRNGNYIAGISHDGNFLVWEKVSYGLGWKAIWESESGNQNRDPTNEYFLRVNSAGRWQVRQKVSSFSDLSIHQGGKSHGDGAYLILGNNGILYSVPSGGDDSRWQSTKQLNDGWGNDEEVEEADYIQHVGWVGDEC